MGTENSNKVLRSRGKKGRTQGNRKSAKEFGVLMVRLHGVSSAQNTFTDSMTQNASKIATKASWLD